MDVLSEIISAKERRVATAKESCPPERMRELAYQARGEGRPHTFLQRLRARGRINIIAEFKRQSPSKGPINAHADPAEVARTYESAGAACISCLTEADYFDGSLDDLRRIRDAVRIPILRKDFIFDEYQVYETASIGADALLLIVAALADSMLIKLRKLAEDDLGMDALVEVHTKEEFERAIGCGARLIGVNNRDLRTFKVSLETSKELARLAPRHTVLVSESGLTPSAVKDLAAAGYHAFLVGETLMRADNAAEVLREFIGQAQSSESPLVKICGITNLADARAAIAAGADMLGFNFYRPSPRFVEVNTAAEIIRELRADLRNEPSVLMVGVFVNETIDSLMSIVADVQLDGVQLHGDETVEYCARLKELALQMSVIKAVRQAGDLPLEALAAHPADFIMVDAFDDELRGGTGRIADWEFARATSRDLPGLFLAGGLSPANVGEAIAKVRPKAVDACSSLETEPGRKSAARMKEFVDAVRSSKLPDEI